MPRNRFTRAMQRKGLFVFAALVFTAAAVAFAQSQPKRPALKKQSGARPPVWSKSVLDVFFPDARRELGDPGTRIANRSSASPATPALPVTATPTAAAATEAAGGFAWSKLISAATLEDEIKASVNLVAADLQTPSKFKGGGNESTRTSYTELAVLFGVIGQYDGDVRWKDKAAGMREAFGAAADSCKVATDAALKKAKEQHESLKGLVQGGNVDVPAAEAAPKWGELVDLPPLMRRLDLVREERLQPWSSSRGELSSHQEDLVHEAEILAVLAQVLMNDDVRKSWDAEKGPDPAFGQYAAELQQHALAVVEAAKQKDLAKLQAGVGAISQTCDKCHGDFQ
ncbi:MAG: cytochrome c [Planctomycetes bacterium]|nr:cytochrome c [Planctomycetota bacterium]